MCNPNGWGSNGKNKTAEHRFFEKCWHNLGTGCIEWMGSINSAGYASFKLPTEAFGPQTVGHRAAFLWANGYLPDWGKREVLDHLCRNRACVNPEHLRHTTSVENVMSGVGISVRERAKTHAPCGHPYTMSNANGTARRCRPCRNRYTRDIKRKIRTTKNEQR